jgi:membrane protein implicated in regulation of membrane protease activity
MWDVTYWTYGCVALAAFFGDWMWWGMLVVPVYSVYSLYGVYRGFRGAGYQDAAGVPQSKRQAKMEKRGGQKVQYR